MPLNLNPFPVGTPPTSFRDFKGVADWARKMWDNLRVVRAGKLDVCRYVQFNQNGTSSTFIDPRLTIQSMVVLSPLNANAIDLYESGIYALGPNRHDGTWTFTHATKPHSDMKFLIMIIG